jgi:hypothetical protein
MSIVRQPAYITKSPISVAIGGTVPVPFPPTPVVPAQDLQINGVLTGTGRGKWVSTIDYYSSQLTGPTTFTFSDLEGVTGNFFTGVPSTTTSISAPNLIYVGNNIGIPGLASLVTLDIPKVQMVVGQIFSGVASFTGLTTINVQSLRAFSQIGNVNIFNVLTTFDLPNVQYIFAGIGLVTFSVLTSLNLSSLIYVGSTGFGFNAPLMTTLTMPTLGTWKACLGNISLTFTALNQASVNSLLDALAYMDGNNGTIAYGTGRLVTITGTSSAPSNLGVVTGLNGSQFVGVGTICTATIANHGYAIGDVIRVAGVGAPLGNANRYAVILSSGFTTGQFQYTITSQTGTGTGVGTVSVTKAGPSAKELVLRGVTLTTN